MSDESQRYWRSAEPKDAYDVVIVGGGGHGLATAYYLARNHGITDVCIVEKGWLAGGNVARNTTVIRSNYLWDASAAIYEHSLKLWEGLEEDLDWDLQFDQKGVLNILHHIGEVRSSTRRVEANHLQGIDAEMLDAKQVQEFCPIIDISPDARYPVLGGALQRRGGTARHDRVAWGSRPARATVVSTSSSTPRSRAFCVVPAEPSPASKRREVRSARTRWRSPRPVTRACWPRWSGCGSPCNRTRSRRS